jgi:hypothetical protein
VASLVDLLSIKGSTNTKSEALIDLGIVGDGDDTTIIDLEL